LVRVVDLISRCHSDIQDHLRGASAMFWVFQVCRNYLSIAERGSGRRASILSGLAEANAVLEQAVGPIRPSFCHNDLLAANLLDDGERLWLLDWEYAGWNSPMFDLANLASNCELDSAGERLLLETYLGQPPDQQDRAAFSAFKCASLLRESLWSLVQEDHSLLDVSYEDYTDRHLARFDDSYSRLAVRP
jgi:thiamine kinase-like enzyme